MARDIDRAIVHDAARTHSVTTRQRLRALGVSDPSIARRVGGLLQRFSAGVYTVGTPTPLTPVAAALHAEPEGCASRFTAASLHGLPVTPGAKVTIVVPNGRRTLMPSSVRAHQSLHLPSDDITEVEGLRVTTVERTLCDLAAVVHRPRLTHLLEWAITHRRADATAFLACVNAYRRRGRTGSALLGEVVATALDGRPIPASELERRGLELVTEAGLDDGFVMHFRPPWSDGVTGIVDGAWPEARVILELDGRRWHATTQAQAEDRRRDRVANAHGWIVARFGWAEVVERPTSTAAELRLLLERRGGS